MGSEELGMSKDQSISVTSFYQDTDRNLWLTTENSGVLVLDGNWKLKQRFLEPERGYSDKLYFVAEQKKVSIGLWVLISYIYSITPRTKYILLIRIMDYS